MTANTSDRDWESFMDAVKIAAQMLLDAWNMAWPLVVLAALIFLNLQLDKEQAHGES